MNFHMHVFHSVKWRYYWWCVCFCLLVFIHPCSFNLPHLHFPWYIIKLESHQIMNLNTLPVTWQDKMLPKTKVFSFFVLFLIKFCFFWVIEIYFTVTLQFQQQRTSKIRCDVVTGSTCECPSHKCFPFRNPHQVDSGQLEHGAVRRADPPAGDEGQEHHPRHRPPERPHLHARALQEERDHDRSRWEHLLGITAKWIPFTQNETLLFQLTWLINASKGSNTLPLAELKPSRQPPSTCLSKRPQPWCPNGSVIRKIQPPFSCYNPQLSIEVVFVSGWLNAGASGGRELQFVALQCRFHLSALQSLLLGNKFPPLGESRAFKWCLLSVYITFHKNCVLPLAMWTRNEKFRKKSCPSPERSASGSEDYFTAAAAV